MSIIIFSSTGCARCNIVKKFFKEENIDFIEFDIKTEDGNNKFKQFYRKYRNNIYRDSQGIFFPVVWDGQSIFQDAGRTLSHYMSHDKLNDSILPNNLGHGWIGGLTLDSVAKEYRGTFVEILVKLKQGGLYVEVETSGLCSELILELLEKNIVDRIKFEIFISDEEKDAVKVEKYKALNVISKYIDKVDADIFTDIGQYSDYLISVDSIRNTAKIINEAMGSNKVRYKILNSDTNRNTNLLVLRTAARQWQIFTDIA